MLVKNVLAYQHAVSLGHSLKKEITGFFLVKESSYTLEFF